MSYRAFKRLLGETSLERKCRFLLGGFILLQTIAAPRKFDPLYISKINTFADAFLEKQKSEGARWSLAATCSSRVCPGSRRRSR